MIAVDRRSFLGTAVPGLAAALAAGSALPHRAATAAETAGTRPDGRPDTLFLTWQRDPTTTMTVQWVGAAADAPDLHVSPARGTPGAGRWAAVHAASRSF